jgi:hypothetical protein
MFLMILISLFLLDLTNATPAQQPNQTCIYTRYNSTFPSISLICHNFNAWSELTAELVSINHTFLPNPIIFKPNQPIALTSELNMSLVAFSSDDNRYIFYDLSGVNVYPWPPLTCLECTKKSLYLYSSTIKFYVNNTSVYPCTAALIPDNSVDRVSFLSKYLDGIYIEYDNTYGTVLGHRPFAPSCSKIVKSAIFDSFFK